MAEEKRVELCGRITPTVEDVVQALMDHLVEPVLPIVGSSQTHSSPDLSLQQSIAKQMHAVVLLYNFYYRKQFPQLEFLDFESFCEVAVVAKPSLIAHLNHMQKCHNDRQFKDNSVTEEAIIDACNISKTLVTLENSPSMEGWPISKIAVFLTDSLMENCWLVYSARTEGVWSPIEKIETECSDNSEGVLGAKQKSETKRKVTWPVRFQNADETRLQELAMSAVKDTTGIDPEELVILRRHVVYSLSEEKTTAHLFIMKCKSVKGDGFQVPIKDAIDSLQGPLIKQSCNSYITGDVIEYFHLLPYAGRIADCFSRKMLAKDSELQQETYLNQSFVHVTGDRNVPIMSRERVLLVNNGQHLEGVGSCSHSDAKRIGGIFERKHMLDVENGNGEGIHEGGDELMLKELASMKFPANKDPDRTLDSNDKSSLTEAILKVCDADKTSNMLKKVYACKKWGETEDIRGEILTQRDELIQRRKRQRMHYQDCTSEIDVDTCIGEVGSKSDKRMSGDVERLDTSSVRCSEVGHVVRDCSSDSPVIPFPKDVCLAGSVCFSRKYMELYKRIVERFGDILKPESMEATSCCDIVSATINGLFEVVDSMLQASCRTVNARVLESWELKLRFCELAGLKVGWLRDHFERIRQASVSSSRIEELEGRASLTVKCLEDKRKRVAELVNELEHARAEVKTLLEEKRVIDTDMAAARQLSDDFSFSPF